MIINKFIGTLCGEPREFQKVSDETFYVQDIKMCNSIVPVVFSEYLLNTAKGKVEVSGYIRSENVDDKLFTFLKAMDITPASEEQQDSSYVDIKGTIVSIKQLVPLNTGKEVVPFIVSYPNNDGNYTVVHLVAYGKTARQIRALKDQLDTKPTIKCRGYISKRQPGITVSVITAEME